MTIHGPAAADKVGVVPFSVAGVDHALVAAVLADEYGIGVRSGCFCAHPYVAQLLGLDRQAAAAWARRVGAGNTAAAPASSGSVSAATPTATTSTARSTRWSPSPPSLHGRAVEDIVGG